MEDYTITIVILFLLSAFFYLFLERLLIKKWRKSFRHVIHVNGIRGKSSVSRMIDGICRRAGYRVFTKTTGTIPQYIDTANQIHTIKRWGRANIREQIKMMHQAYLQKAEILILECMAVDPYLQQLSEEQILQADIGIITNVRKDHLEEMGSTYDEIATSLAKMIPTKGTLILGQANDILEKKAKEKNSQVFVAKQTTNTNLIVNEENKQLALACAFVLGIDLDCAEEGFRSYHLDPGATKIWRLEKTILINCFSVNDPESTLHQIQLAKKLFNRPLTYILNSRSDRPSRIKQHIDLLNQIKPEKIWLTGDATLYIKRRLESCIQTKILKSNEQLLDDDILFGFGNIAHHGQDIIDYFAKGEEYDG